jgi:hypothetical protein
MRHNIRFNLAAFVALALCVAAFALGGCASYEGPDGTEASAFGQGEVTFESVRCPEPDDTAPTVAPADCPTVTVTVTSKGFSDNFRAVFDALVEAAAGVFGGGSPPDVIVNVPPNG